MEGIDLRQRWDVGRDRGSRSNIWDLEKNINSLRSNNSQRRDLQWRWKIGSHFGSTGDSKDTGYVKRMGTRKPFFAPSDKRNEVGDEGKDGRLCDKGNSKTVDRFGVTKKRVWKMDEWMEVKTVTKITKLWVHLIRRLRNPKHTELKKQRSMYKM